MVRNFILLSLILIICASCGTSLFSRNSRDEYEIREVQNLSEKLRVKIIAKADSLMIERGVKLDRYVSSIGENDLFYFVIYQGIGFI